MNKIKVLLADDHPIVRNGIKNLLENSGEVNVIGEASNGEQALAMVGELNPDLVISDLEMPGINGLQLADKIREKGMNTKVIIFSMHNEEEYVIGAFDSGALGYIPKDCSEKDLLTGIHTVLEGREYISDKVAKLLASNLVKQRKVSHAATKLTTREKEVLTCIVNGLSNKQIAEKLFISNRTVETHRTNIMKKLNLKNTAQLVRTAISQNLI